LLILLLSIMIVGSASARFDHTAIDSICNAIEPDAELNSSLKAYTLHSLSGDPITLAHERLNHLFGSNSFARMAQVLLDDNLLNEFDLTDGRYTKDYFAVYRFNYLSNSTDTCALYTIAEQLLKQDNINGLLGLWNNCDIQRLPSYNALRDKVIENRDPYRHAILTAIMFNSHNGKEYGPLRALLQSRYSSDPAIARISDLFDRGDALSLDEFMNTLDSY
ncbi:MAG: hypothetical protein K2K86_08270, partial [Muribaculaceae bacterium]|nr:hypothetical protein [Muribaculaceae bacterium]